MLMWSPLIVPVLNLLAVHVQSFNVTISELSPEKGPKVIKLHH